MSFSDNQALFGHHPQPCIVSVELTAPDEITLYLRDPDGSTTARIEPFAPFFWADSEIADEALTITRLEGELDFLFLCESPDWRHFTRLRTGLRGTGIRHFALGDPVQQFLLRTGRTLFKGMAFPDLRRLQIALTPDAIDLCDSTGWAESIALESCRAALERLTDILRERDPDVIEGHDLFKKILPALAARGKSAKLKLPWGRNDSPPTSRSSRLQIAEKTIEYPKFQIHGRHLVDTFLLAQFYDVSARELESYTLADVAAHFRIANISPASQTRELAAILSASHFIQAQIFPYNYQDVIIRGNATRIDALFLREYLRRGHSIPEVPEARPFEGGYTDIFHTGVTRDVWHVDVASLYPSVMLRFDCFPVRDTLGVFRGLLTDLKKFRLEAKARLREAAPAERGELQALQSAFKILINSFYGYLGFGQGHFADFDAASRVTQIGRDLLRQMVESLQQSGAQVIEIDTDGIYFVPPPAATVEQLQTSLGNVLPEGIEVEFDTRYRAMFSYKAKNYALLTDEDELILRGGALKSRGLEKFQRTFLERMIRLLMEDRSSKVAALHDEFEHAIRQRAWPIEMLMKTETLQNSLTQYQAKIAGSARNRAAAYELALASGARYQPGDQVSYYITGEKKTVSAYDNSRLASDWNPEARDENIEYYVAKLNDLLKKFASFITAPADNAQINLL